MIHVVAVVLVAKRSAVWDGQNSVQLCRTCRACDLLDVLVDVIRSRNDLKITGIALTNAPPCSGKVIQISVFQIACFLEHDRVTPASRQTLDERPTSIMASTVAECRQNWRRFLGRVRKGP